MAGNWETRAVRHNACHGGGCFLTGGSEGCCLRLGVEGGASVMRL